MPFHWPGEELRPQKLERILVENQIISESQLNWARIRQNETGKRIEDVLLQAEIVDEKSLNQAYSIFSGIPVFDGEIIPAEEALQLVSPDLCHEYGFLPVDRNEGYVRIVVSHPLHPELLQIIRDKTGLEAVPFLAGKNRIEQALEKSLRQGREIPALENSVIRMMEDILRQAWSEGASDIHFEWNAGDLSVKFRLHGELVEKYSHDRATAELLITRLKIVSSLDITEHTMPQDGQFSQQDTGGPIVCRCSLIPAFYGENAVVRILNRRNFSFSLDNIGLTGEQVEIFKSSLQNPSGLILVSGSTGSGKTTTLYATLSFLTRSFPQKKIVTIEDPIEYPLPGITQTQASESWSGEKPRMNFAVGLKALLRQDPDIIMIGEIRDRESAMIAINAAMTGHQVLATIHARDVFDIFGRLQHFEIKPSLFLDCISLLVAQKLFKKVCSTCRGVTGGCPACSGKGYSGRMGTFEILALDEKIKCAVMAGALPSGIKKTAEDAGFCSIAARLKEKLQCGEVSHQEFSELIGGSTSVQ
ncbi:MAG: GspE/PulE family protein [Candidatus Wallbacteria bacterium]|nr:GspE/PulE family protein [Candidatus Wallbacteria bacterium]